MHKIKRIMRLKIAAILGGGISPETESKVNSILGEESDEDAEGNINKKIIFQSKKKKAALAAAAQNAKLAESEAGEGEEDEFEDAEESDDGCDNMEWTVEPKRITDAMMEAMTNVAPGGKNYTHNHPCVKAYSDLIVSQMKTMIWLDRMSRKEVTMSQKIARMMMSELSMLPLL